MSVFPPPGPKGGARQRLLALFERLGDGDRDTLIAFAEFLAARRPAVPAGPPEPPRPIARPESETVVAAIRRLSASYPMLDRRRLLNTTSSLMAQHILHGRAAADVIDELERGFAAHYEEFVTASRRQAEPDEEGPDVG